jgi:hypothetical protein
MSNYSIPFVRTNINSTSTTSLPYVTNPIRIRPISITSSNTVPITITLTRSSSVVNNTGGYTDTYGANQTGNISFSNFNIPNVTSFSKPPITFNTSSSLPTDIRVSYSNITNTGFTYNISGSFQVLSMGQSSTSITRNGSITYFAST